NTPRESRATRGYILQPLTQQAQDLVPPALRLHELLVPCNVVEQEFAVARQPEKPVALLHPLQRSRRVQDALSVHDFGVLLERLASHTIPALVGLLVEVVRIALEDAFDQLPDAGFVLRRGRADE